MLALWAFVIWMISMALGWYGLQHSSFTLDPGSEVSLFSLFALPFLLTVMLISTAYDLPIPVIDRAER